MLNKFTARELNCRVLLVFNSHIRQWKEHVRTTLEPLQEAIKSGLESGDIEFAGYSANNYCLHILFIGDPLAETAKKMGQYIALMQKLKQTFAINNPKIGRQLILNLQGKAENKVHLNGESFNEAEMLPLFIEAKNATLLFFVYLAKTILFYLFKEFDKAFESALLAEQYAKGATGLLTVAEHNFYYSLTILAMNSTLETDKQVEYLNLVDANQQVMKKWAFHAPMNFQHKYDLIEAEKARILGDDLLAMDLYEKAITGAKENEYLHEEALAYELTGQFYWTRGNLKISHMYLRDAHYAYQQWGALAKVEDLEEKYPQLLGPKIARTIPSDITISTTQVISTSNKRGSEWLDLGSIMKATQILSGEIVLSRLLEKMMQIVIENAGAERGFLLLPKQGGWFIQAEGHVNSSDTTILQSLPLEESEWISVNIVYYVARTQENIVLHDATRDGNFTHDSYIIKHNPKSVLCMPLLNQGQLTGILYLENNLTTGAFTPTRLKVLNLLSSQIAISVENSLLYNNLKEKVAERTSELEQEIIERKQVEKERQEYILFLENLEKINRVIAQTTDIEKMMDDTLDAVLAIFDCDRAWLLYPCDPEAPAWWIPMEKTKPEYPGAAVSGKEYAMTPDVAEDLRNLLATKEPLVAELKPKEPEWDPEDKYAIRAIMSIAIHPKVGKPWDFGLHQCSHTRIWTKSEQRLFKEISQRIVDALSNLLFFRDLTKSEEKHRLLFESMVQGVVYQNVNGVIISANPAAEQLLGLTLDQMRGRTSIDSRWKTIHEDGSDFPGETHPATVSLQTGEQVKDVIMGVFHPLEEDYRWINVNAIPQFKPNENTPYQVYTTFEDITERKRAEATQQESNKIQNAILSTTDVLLAYMDREFNFVAVNQAYANAGCRQREDFIDKNHFDLYPHEENQALFESVVKTGKPLYISAKPFEHPDQPERGTTWWNWSLIPIKDESGNVQTLVFSLLDVTELTRVKDALKQTNKILLIAEKTAKAGSWKWELKTNRVIWSENLCLLHGIEPEDFDSTIEAVIQFIHPDDCDSVTDKIQTMLSEKRGMPFEYRILTANKELKFVEGTNQLIFDREGNITELIGMIHDITEHKRAQEELKKAKEKADSANQAKSTFLANMSHELRTPLNGILGYAQILKRDPITPSQHQHSLDVVEQSGYHLLALINDVLDLAKIESGKIELYVTDFNLPSLLNGVSEIIKIRAEHKDISFFLEFADNLPHMVHGDERRLRQVLLNLLGNAVKFTDKGSVTLQVKSEKLMVNSEEQEKQSQISKPSDTALKRFQFSIQDTGVGISPENLDTIFDPFEQVGEQKRQAKGTGLGLAVSKNLVELMGGQLYVSSQLNVGTQFWFELALPVVNDHSGITQVTRQLIIGIEEEPPKILVVDDDSDNRAVLVDLLSPLGFIIKQANNGHEGLETAMKWQPDVIITDLIMPQMNGFELIRCLRQSPVLNEKIIITTSASVYEEDKEKSLNVGSNAFLPKPIQIKTLLEKLQQLLNLTWIHEDKKNEEETTTENGISQPMIFPPITELEQLYELSLMGDINELEEQVAILAKSDVTLKPFVTKIQVFLKNYQMGKLSNWLEEEITNIIQNSGAITDDQ
ncbi:PAS domain S-box protein [Anaerolineales bacterium HSG24]|nr:PAS domain S-box protein [Anaerolineales bacterium HSG24]